ncbi:ABC transporter substrate-binding protein [Devosia sediminis]|uniref:ABC transporter substrate-binding protein n=1 Tax=Devosia sediminis TaxID=2798801 RepID=A0A934MRJ8_9HYPH|nr:ABC transporter substrate-binding protein [Devosia sediminis]MBJ3785494.1 ABC transporter substrate-binding protein [Devosia sediminis]
MLRSAAIALALLATSALPAFAQWSYVGGNGETVMLDAVPTRIIASQDAAAGLIPLGIRPVAIYADSAVADAKALQGLDLTGIEIIGQAWGEVDIEKAAALEPDLIVAEFWPLETTWSGGADVVNALSPLAPITGPEQGASILTLIEDYEELAASLGADLAAPSIAADKAAFETALADFKAATAAKPDLTALAVWAGEDALYVAATGGASELMDFASWGLKLIDPEVADDRGYWETLSWENADKYQPDLILVDNRSAQTMETALAQPTWTLMKAAEAGQVTDWPAYWLRNYGAYASELAKLTTAINAADENLAP